MAYTKKTWVKGSTPLSAENFNHMEQGIADAHSSIAQLNSDTASDFRIFSGLWNFPVRRVRIRCGRRPEEP